ncbi:MAG TPA: DNA polymerase III subunit gamma/tau, partial [Candidatus Enterocola sp.]|nr:DNA polymerase III subunit gamma/tau [Candidatus Enterocola sp.]
EVGSSIRDKYIEQASRCSVDFLYDALEVCNDCDISYKQSKNKRLAVELMLIRLCQLSGQKKN